VGIRSVIGDEYKVSIRQDSSSVDPHEPSLGISQRISVAYSAHPGGTLVNERLLGVRKGSWNNALRRNTIVWDFMSPVDSAYRVHEVPVWWQTGVHHWHGVYHPRSEVDAPNLRGGGKVRYDKEHFLTLVGGGSIIVGMIVKLINERKLPVSNLYMG
jgi:hypothetical protein